MLRRSDEMKLENIEKLRGGDGTVTIKHLFGKEELLGKTRLVAETILPVGTSIGFHHHENEEEIYYILSGKGEVIDDDSIQNVSAGFAMLTGNGKGHSIRNTGEEPLVFLSLILLYS